MCLCSNFKSYLETLITRYINSSDTTTRNMDKEISAKTIESDILVYRCNEISLQRAPDTFKNH